MDDIKVSKTQENKIQSQYIAKQVSSGLSLRFNVVVGVLKGVAAGVILVPETEGGTVGPCKSP